MADVQHIYSGEGSPYDLGIHGSVGSHYINELRPDEVWIATQHDPHEPSTEWVKLKEVYAPFVSGGLAVMSEGAWVDWDLVLEGGTFRIEGDGTVYSNVELEQAGGYRSYTSAQPFRVQVVVGAGGEAIITITPLLLTLSASAG